MLSKRRFSPEEPDSSKDPNQKPGTRVDWTDQELLGVLKQVMNPAKKYRVRLPGRETWLETTGKKLFIWAHLVVGHQAGAQSHVAIIMSEAIRELFRGMRTSDAQAAQPEDRLAAIRKSIEDLEYPPRDDYEPSWDAGDPIIKL